MVSLAAIGSTAQNPGWPGPPNHPTAHRLRQASVLQMQRVYGNAYVQRLLEQQNLGPYAAKPLVQLDPEEEVASSNATPQPLVQRQEEEGGDGDEPTEEEKAAALAAA